MNTGRMTVIPFLCGVMKGEEGVEQVRYVHGNSLLIDLRSGEKSCPTFYSHKRMRLNKKGFGPCLSREVISSGFGQSPIFQDATPTCYPLLFLAFSWDQVWTYNVCFQSSKMDQTHVLIKPNPRPLQFTSYSVSYPVICPTTYRNLLETAVRLHSIETF